MPDGFIGLGRLLTPTISTSSVAPILSPASTRSTRVYDIATNTWTRAEHAGRAQLMASGYNPGNGKIYLVGGYSTGHTSHRHTTRPGSSIQSPATFTTGPLAHPRAAGALRMINGHLYQAAAAMPTRSRSTSPSTTTSPPTPGRRGRDARRRTRPGGRLSRHFNKLYSMQHGVPPYGQLLTRAMWSTVRHRCEVA